MSAVDVILLSFLIVLAVVQVIITVPLTARLLAETISYIDTRLRYSTIRLPFDWRYVIKGK